jgi:hypothetical protein
MCGNVETVAMFRDKDHAETFIEALRITEAVIS